MNLLTLTRLQSIKYKKIPIKVPIICSLAFLVVFILALTGSCQNSPGDIPRAGDSVFHSNQQNRFPAGLPVGRESEIIPKTKKSVNLPGAVALSAGYNLSITMLLLACPPSVSNWELPDDLKWRNLKRQYRSSFTQLPVRDQDAWFVNYIGHPYQGSFYFNTLRSQGASIAESFLFGVANTLAWEYFWEGGLEQPSIQDLLVTPLAGALWGEAANQITIALGRNGYKWYEKTVVAILNPAWTLTHLLNRGKKKKGAQKESRN